METENENEIANDYINLIVKKAGFSVVQSFYLNDFQIWVEFNPETSVKIKSTIDLCGEDPKLEDCYLTIEILCTPDYCSGKKRRKIYGGEFILTENGEVDSHFYSTLLKNWKLFYKK